MKVLFVAAYYTTNSYVTDIVDGVKQTAEVVCSPESFWSSNMHFDIVHFQWPEAVYFTASNKAKQNILTYIAERISYWKSRGSKIVATRHNERSHYSFPSANEVCELVYNNADAMIHLGNYSLEKLSNKNGINVVIPHPNYNSIIEENITKSQARAILDINEDDLLYVSIGAIRKIKEEELLLDSFVKLKKKNKKLIVCNSLLMKSIPRFYSSPIRRIKIHRRIKNYINQGVIFGKNNYNDHELNLYLQAADIVVSPRVDTLNSGVIYLGMSFGKVVIGPSIANMKEILTINNNPTFDPSDIMSLTNAYDKAIEDKDRLGHKNKEYSDQELDIRVICASHLELYRQLLE